METTSNFYFIFFSECFSNGSDHSPPPPPEKAILIGVSEGKREGDDLEKHLG